jgi:hypothetical protein
MGKILRLAAAGLALVALAGPASGGDGRPLGVVELFTSQGCSSCPPADAVFGAIAGKDDVVALAYHVDYWDYLGWRDTLARPENTARQYDYAHAFGSRSVYTPQAVINGRAHVNGASRAAIEARLEGFARSGEGLSVPVSIERVGDSLVIETGAADDKATDKATGKATGKATVVLVYFDPAAPVTIERGENAGRTVTYWNAVTGIQTAGMWHGAATRYEMPASEIDRKRAGGCAVLLQAAGKGDVPGPILGAAVLDKADLL